MAERRYRDDNNENRRLSGLDQDEMREAELLSQTMGIESPEKRVVRAAVREEMRNICHALSEEVPTKTLQQKHDLCDKLASAIKHVDHVYEEIKGDSKDLAVDADVIMAATKCLMEVVKGIDEDSSDRAFNGTAFAERLVEFLSSKRNLKQRRARPAGFNPLMQESDDEEDERDDDDEDQKTIEPDYEGKLTRADWALFGRMAANASGQAPGLSFLRGAMNFDSLEPKEKKIKSERTARTVKEEKPDKVVLTAKTEADHANDEVSVSKELDWVRRCLKKEYKRTKEPVDYFSFVIDPNDFGKTVENMFYVSFLVKDAQICYSIGDKGLPVLSYPPEHARLALLSEDRTARRTHQAIMSFTMENWRRFKAALKITEAKIPPQPMGE